LASRLSEGKKRGQVKKSILEEEREKPHERSTGRPAKVGQTLWTRLGILITTNVAHAPGPAGENASSGTQNKPDIIQTAGGGQVTMKKEQGSWSL